MLDEFCDDLSVMIGCSVPELFQRIASREFAAVRVEVAAPGELLTAGHLYIKHLFWMRGVKQFVIGSRSTNPANALAPHWHRGSRPFRQVPPAGPGHDNN